MRFGKSGLVAFVLMAAGQAPAYYHFIHYLNGQSVPEKFDLTALPSKTVTFFVSGKGPTLYAQNDTFSSVLSQIREATGVWNGIATSDMRVAFGGLENASTPQNAPGGDVVFEDLPPGLLGYGGPTSKLVPVTGTNGGAFVPIARSVVHLNRNLTVLPGPSFRETFFMTVVHEMGHALGLQHTFTSATMSQATTRATTLSHPVDADDIAGISVLYPNAAFAQFGSITGRITTALSGVHLASVVAIRAGAGAVSGVTNRDGTFRIDGLPPGQYVLYAHTMPPDADIYGPWNADGTLAPGSPPVNSLFYPGTSNLQQALPLAVQAGKSVDGVNMALFTRASVEIYDVQIFGYLNNNTIAVEPAFVNMLGGNTAVSATGVGLGANGQTSVQNVQILGGAATVIANGVVPLVSGGSTYLGLYLGFNTAAGPGPQHVVFTTPTYMHVLPSGIIATQMAPPIVTAVSTNGDGTLTVTGKNWTGGSQIYFDGLPGVISSLDPVAGSATIVPPSGAAGQTATVTVYNPDGQNSQLVQSASPITYSYGGLGPTGIVAISPSSLPAGAEAMVDITGFGFNFSPGGVAVGFGSSDVLVRRVFVLSPNHLQVDVWVAANASLSNPDVSVVAGFPFATLPAGFQIVPPVAGLPAPVPVFENALPGLTGIYAGAVASIYGTNLSVNGNTAVTIAGKPATILYASPSQINLQIPAGLIPGTALVTLFNGAVSAYPIAINIDTLPAGINAIQNASGAYIDASHPAHQGDVLIVGLSNFAPAGSPTGSTIAPGRVQVSLGGRLHNAIQVSSPDPAYYQVSFQLDANEPVGVAQSLIVYLDGRSSYPGTIAVTHPDGN